MVTCEDVAGRATGEKKSRVSLRRAGLDAQGDHAKQDDYSVTHHFLLPIVPRGSGRGGPVTYCGKAAMRSDRMRA